MGIRCWSVVAGMLGERVPDAVSFNPSWHHNYATLAWWSEQAVEAAAPHYPTVSADRVALTEALHRIANNAAERKRFATDPAAFAAEIDMSGEEKQALVEMDLKAFATLGIHPFVPFMARLQLEREA